MCHGVCDTETYVGVCHGGYILCKCHALTSIRIVLYGLTKVLGDELDSLEIEYIGELPCTLGGVTLDGVCQRIHTGRSGEALRHGGHHIRINDGDIRDIVCIDADELSLLLNIGDNVVDGGLCTGTTGCRNGDGEYSTMLGRCNTLKGTDICELRVVDDDTDALTGIHGRTTTDGDHAVCTAGLVRLYTVLDVLDGWVRLDVIIQEEVNVVLLQKIGYLGCYAELYEVRIGCNESLMIASCLDETRDLLDCTMSMIGNTI